MTWTAESEASASAERDHQRKTLIPFHVAINPSIYITVSL